MSTEPLLTISTFARLVGLTPSALRFYDDCELLRPASVDERTGYRYYTSHQQHPAILVRRMRDIDLPLTQIRMVLDSPPAEAAALLRSHVAMTMDKADVAKTVVDDLITALKERDQSGAGLTVARLDGLELASAVRQVAPAAAAEGDESGLDGVLLEVAPGEVAVVATDRYWLALRTLQADVEGESRRVLVPKADLVAVAGWARAHGDIELRVDAQTAALVATSTGGTAHDQQTRDQRTRDQRTRDQRTRDQRTRDQRTLTVSDDRFPTYRSILDHLSPWVTRVILDRAQLLDFVLTTDPEETVRLVIGSDRVDAFRGTAPLPARMAAVCIGEPMTAGFSPGLLAPALEAAVGPDVLLELSEPNQPCVLRSADQGTFSTLVMPRRLSA